MSFIEPNDLRNPKLLNQIKEILGKINIPVDILKELKVMNNNYEDCIKRCVELFDHAKIDRRYKICQCVFKTLSFKDDKLEFTLNKPFDIFVNL